MPSSGGLGVKKFWGKKIWDIKIGVGQGLFLKIHYCTYIQINIYLPLHLN
jgi:hypothetical protein